MLIVAFLISNRNPLNEATSAKENTMIISTAAITIQIFSMFLAEVFIDGFLVPSEVEVKCLGIRGGEE